jgi:hypothetical protein
MPHPMHQTIPAGLGDDPAFATLIRGALGHVFPLNSCRLARDASGSFIVCEDDAGREWSLVIFRDGTGGR